MPFITVAPGDRRDLSLCLCYLEWLEDGRVPAGGMDPQDTPLLNKTYDFVQAGDALSPVIGQTDSDPIRTMMLLYTKYQVKLYCLNAQQPQYYNAVTVNQRNQAFIDRINLYSGILDEDPPDPRTWIPRTSAIVRCDAQNPASGAQEKHWVLYRKGGNGEIYRYDPWQGLAEPTWNYEQFVSGNYLITPVSIALLIQ